MRGITLVVFVALAQGTCGLPWWYRRTIPTFKDLLTSLNTSDPIWKKSQNYTNNHKCTRATKVFLNQTMYIFNQTYRDGNEEMMTTLYAKLKNGTQGRPPLMRVSADPGGKGIPYHLKYWNSTERCGILRYRVNGSVGCEMHVWNSNITMPVPICETKYKSICTGTSYSVYDSSCKSTLQKNLEHQKENSSHNGTSSPLW